ncbi:hypothetical protein E2C01_047513 [Portunus trituberculatus]|uniref:Uncharacterized protein n=1 Tax=Portunus trituberculatus TaxID=210409 RepID=A0A5B7G3T0_PORTR|nr:hypothetical protein [Portunus trituberculatus]
MSYASLYVVHVVCCVHEGGSEVQACAASTVFVYAWVCLFPTHEALLCSSSTICSNTSTPVGDNANLAPAFQAC